MRKVVLLGAVASMLAIAPASAQSLTQFLQSANLDPLAQSPKVLNLEAQSSSKTAQADVNAFDDFFLINGPGKLVVDILDKQLQKKGDVPIRGWIGVAHVLQSRHHGRSAGRVRGGEGAIQDAERRGRPRRRLQDHQHATARARLCGAEDARRPEPRQTDCSRRRQAPTSLAPTGSFWTLAGS